MKSTEHFKNVIQVYLESRAAHDIKDEGVTLRQSRERKFLYYKNIVKRHLNDIKEDIKSSKNRMEENYYRNRYVVQLGVYAKALNVQEKYLERFICPPSQTFIHKNQ